MAVQSIRLGKGAPRRPLRIAERKRSNPISIGPLAVACGSPVGRRRPLADSRLESRPAWLACQMLAPSG